ncbi:MAG: HAD family hydrolase [Clostridiales bacterium]|nr:HAD family hydrolase [Clostridiales bacterium]
MRKINYGLIVSDFDGTLVSENGNIPEKNKSAIAEYVKDGGKFAISTGRLHYGIVPRAKELGLRGAVSCCQGAVIMDIESGKPLLNGVLSNEVTVQICRKMEELQLHIHVYGFDEFYCNKNDEALRFYERLVGKKATLITEEPLSAFVKETGIQAYKLLTIVEPQRAEGIMQALAKENFDGCVVTKSADFLVEVINANYSKGTAVEFLSKYYSVPLEKTIAVGDQLNDVPMIKRAGLGLAVNNADERLKKEAIVLESTNEEGAIAEVIEKYGYMEEGI